MEKEFKVEVKNTLSNDFDFYSEVQGTHFSGMRLRIDDIVVPKDISNWKNKKVAFGIEYKDTKRIDGDTTNFTSWIAQCVDYANTKWDNFGYIYILTCPSIHSTSFIKEVDKEKMLTKVMSHLGIGELKNLDRYGWSIVLQENHRIWSEFRGVESGKHWSLERKFGSR
ncbi:hypothetical protein EMA8858_04143 [Emticicia aquatica]|jgi:hypothetical protein|uniref:Restriction endonuclease n=1 Tax=Emticicia aquatica TaxID=1681835 RepID=A0ABN8F3C1_9BACT|nr:hypothetical protein [Emticicia aquatica]CAH0998008.1 hypothetical protein EMA8858_04143 [Emticicia aquatica]